MTQDSGKLRKERAKQEVSTSQDSFLGKPFFLDIDDAQLVDQHGYRQKAMQLLRQLVRHPLVPDQFAQVFLLAKDEREKQRILGGGPAHEGTDEPDNKSDEQEFGLNKKSAEDIRELLSQVGESSHKEAVLRIEALQAVLANLRL